MKQLVLALMLALSPVVASAQDHGAKPQGEAAHGAQDGKVPHGGAEAVHPGGSADTHAEAAAKHGEGHSEEAMPNEIWWKWANFAILALILGWLIKKNAGPFFAARSQAIASGIAEAAKTRQEAEARAAEIERRVSNLSSEVDQLRQRSHEEIAREGERVRAETADQIRKVQAQAQAEIASSAKHAMHDLKAASAQIAMQLAERQIRDRMTPAAQDAATAQFLADLNRKTVN